MNREDFNMLNNNIIYFDNSATTFKPKIVIEAMDNYYNYYCANVHRGDYNISIDASDAFENARETIKNFINAKDVREIIWTSGTTNSLNQIVFGYFKNILKKNDEIILSKSEHASNILPWFIIAKNLNLKIRYVDLNKNKEVTLDNIKKIININTKVISLALTTNVIGDTRDIKNIAKLAHENNILIVVDGAQGMCHNIIDVQDLDIDFLAFSAHKMYGPTGTGILYGKYKLLSNVVPLNYGGGMNSNFENDTNIELKELPEKLEAGTQNIAGAIGFAEAVNYINNIGIKKINKYIYEIREYLVNELKKLDFITIYDENSKGSIVAFNVKNVFSQDTAIYLNKYNICIRAGNHCAKILKDEIGIANTCRISLAMYNTKEEIDLLINALKNIKNIYKEIL